ncbi:hypothetical protein [Mesorhizobium sp. NPDC059025]|uniref:hypothetical protein n=1 Tax=unclassified Mesorhizobium TaxID=325217 RepID=UPI0036CB2EE2
MFSAAATNAAPDAQGRFFVDINDIILGGSYRDLARSIENWGIDRPLGASISFDRPRFTSKQAVIVRPMTAFHRPIEIPCRSALERLDRERGRAQDGDDDNTRKEAKQHSLPLLP